MKKLSLLIGLAFLISISGCYKAVVFDKQGRAFSPYTGKQIKPHTEVCPDTGHYIRWTNQRVVSFGCNGKALCPDCHGSGQIYDREGLRTKCGYCRGTGKCYDSDDGGRKVWGNSTVRLDINRRQLATEKKD